MMLFAAFFSQNCVSQRKMFLSFIYKYPFFFLRIEETKMLMSISMNAKFSDKATFKADNLLIHTASDSHIGGVCIRTPSSSCGQTRTAHLKVFNESHLNHSPVRNRKDCHATQIRQPNTDAHAPLYDITCAPHVSNAVTLIKEQEQVPLLA